MKIAIIGYSGSGKSTLARKLGNYYNCNVLHLDSIHFAPNWEERKYDDMIDDVSSMLEKRTWIIEGNYKKLLYQERLADADEIIFLTLIASTACGEHLNVTVSFVVRLDLIWPMDARKN
ncbi:DNA topology modulation protein [Streptococcus agalactiae]|nr:DNA topology modulation protein [Streptococcus agalactiae]